MSNSSAKVRTRSAPSPTGFVHIGNFRTILFSYLYARVNHGNAILRIEDTDKTRQVEGAIEGLLEVLHQLGIDHDEGFYLDNGQLQERGEFGPYLQSKRLDLYQKYAKQLVEQGSAYYCFCDETRLEELRKEQTALKKPPMYDRHCRYLSKEEIQNKLDEFKAAGTNPVIRQAIPEQGHTTVKDLVYGDMTFDHAVLDDQVLLKSDGFPTYHLAVVVDDHAMEISHVIRGEEWISSTPKHLLLYQAFGWTPTAFAHLPLILNPDKSKLSKRQGDVAVEDFLSKGYLKEALINFVAFLGWNPKTEQEFFTLPELIDQFDLSKVNNSPAVFDINKLDSINSHYIRSKTNADLLDLLLPFWPQAKDQPRNYLEAIVGLEKDRLKKLSAIGERTDYFFHQPQYDSSLLVWKKSDSAQTKQVLQQLQEFITGLSDADLTDATILEQRIKDFIAHHGWDNGTVLWPLRVSLTGLEKSPGPFELVATLALGLGKEAVMKRLEIASQKLA